MLVIGVGGFSCVGIRAMGWDEGRQCFHAGLEAEDELVGGSTIAWTLFGERASGNGSWREEMSAF